MTCLCDSTFINGHRYDIFVLLGVSESQQKIKLNTFTGLVNYSIRRNGLPQPMHSMGDESMQKIQY